ncbi:Hypothetical protein NTJ_09754 [Nesidiocoris tenuis]|uniref:Uncharacterized protein n=1 Tax=Nesidiocoris tenuis TaxID=355587 RepID=A0ABN7AXN1_9HEMI|nr:Hypothetical protein NTJ_09754 [Nesidiocoris tenuis]
MRIFIILCLFGLSAGYRIDYNQNISPSSTGNSYGNQYDEQNSRDYDYGSSSEDDGENEGSFLDELNDHSELEEQDDDEDSQDDAPQAWNGPLAQPPGYQPNGAPLPVQDLPEVAAEKQRHLQLYAHGPHAAAVAAGQPPYGSPVYGGYATPWVPLIRHPVVNQYQAPVYSLG